MNDQIFFILVVNIYFLFNVIIASLLVIIRAISLCFRSQIFVRNSGNSQILLMHAMNEEQNPEAMSILKLLEQKTVPVSVA